MSGGLEFNFWNFQWSKTPIASTLSIYWNWLYLLNPQAEYAGEWYDLQPLGTEGQNDVSYSNTKPYKLVTAILPTGFGFKYNLGRRINVGVDMYIA